MVRSENIIVRFLYLVDDCCVALRIAILQVTGEGTEDKYLIATSEQPMCAFHKGEWLAESELPLRYDLDLGTKYCLCVRLVASPALC